MFIQFLLVVVTLFCVLTWIAPIVISLLLARKFNASVKIGRFGILYLKLYDLEYIKSGITIHVKEISLNSSFLNSEVKKLVTLAVKDVKFIYNGNQSSHTQAQSTEPVDFRNKKIPISVPAFAQFMAVHIYNISVIIDNRLEKHCIYGGANEVHLDGSIVQNAQTLLVNVNILQASAFILPSANENINQKTHMELEQNALATIKFAILLEATLIAHGPLAFEKLSIAMWHTSATVSEGFYSLVQSKQQKKVEQQCIHNSQDVYERMAPVIPKNMMLRIDNVSLRGVRSSGRSDFSSSLNNFVCSYRFFSSSSAQAIRTSCTMDELLVENNTEQLLIMRRIKLDAKIENYLVDIYLYLHTLTITYNHEVIYNWLLTNFLQNKRTSPTAKDNSFLSPYSFSGCAECINVTSLFKFHSGYVSSLGLNQGKLIFNETERQAELLLDSLWWSFKDFGHDANITKKRHFWGTPLYVGMMLIHYDACDSLSCTKIHGIIDTFRFEWSNSLAEYILVAEKALRQYEINYQGQRRHSQSTARNKINLNITLHQVNLFFNTAINEYIILRLDALKYENSTLTFEETKMLITSNSHAYYNCLRSEDLKKYVLYVQLAKIGEVLDVHLLEKIDIEWSVNVHLKILYLVRDIKEFVHFFATPDISKRKNQSNYSLDIKGEFNFNIKISELHKMRISLDDLSLVQNSKGVQLNNAALEIAIDDKSIFFIKGIRCRPLDSHEAIRIERTENEFASEWNDARAISINSFQAIFPYEHNYSNAIHNDLFTLIKFLRRTHSSSNTSNLLPKDMLININDFLLEMSEDPFEVKIRDNFELLADEYNESLKRNKKLADKVSQLLKKQLHLPDWKVDELYANLQEKNTQIYIQRSKQLREGATERRTLFAWSVTDIEIMLLADSTIHDKEKCIKMMQTVDCDSPWPEEGLDFSTLWCRVVSMRCAEWRFQLRDFPQPLLLIQQWYICGTILGAEQVAPRRGRRNVEIDLGEPFDPVMIERALLPLKFYHDLNCEIQSYSYAFGPCWEPVIAQCNLSFEKILSPSRDPSPPLPFWDKMRLLLHGRLTMEIQQLTVLLHASKDPYNTTEEMELTWQSVIMDWTNGKLIFKGDFNIFVRTASKYDDVQLLHLPNLKLIILLEWVCLGDPKDHHSVIHCAPDQVPEYSSNQVHDSFRAFRSQNLNLSITLETRPTSNLLINPTPTLSLFGSTLRWFENLKLILQGVTRPTRRGRIFNNMRPKKKQLSRHYKKIHLLLGLHKFQICYWMSSTMQRGCELLGGHIASTSEHILNLNNIDDGLIHRPKAEWSIVYVTSELSDSEIWLKSALLKDDDMELMTLRQPVEKCYFLSVAKVSYGREPNEHEHKNKDTPTHRLVVYDLKGAWTQSNRNVVFAIFDTFMKNKQLKKNLSTEVLKAFRKEPNAGTTPLKNRRNLDDTPTSSKIGTNKLEQGQAATMLQQLIAEAENKNVVFSDDLSSATRQQHLQGPQACQEDDVLYKNWNIALVNAQVLLKGCETKGYVILSAAKAEIVQRIHRPVWKECTLVSKTTWVGTLECMQYYATVNEGNDNINENILWLTVDNIQEKEQTVISELLQVPNMVGCGVSVGAVVSDTVGASSLDSDVQLQRIVSRCKCEFFYVGYGDISVDPATLGELPPCPQEDFEPFFRRPSAVNAFTLMHHDLDVCTNSLQYAMLLDIINNLLLYVDTHRKEQLERLARMRFQLQLQNVIEKKPIQILQTKVRSSLSRLRRLEKETYLVHKALIDDPANRELEEDIAALETDVFECKTLLNMQAEELDMMLSCYKESQLLATNRLKTTCNDLRIVRANEIFFKHAQWRLTEADGQIGIADLVLSNFLYTKNSKSDDSVEHLLELGYLRMTNLLPNQIYKEVILPTEIQSNMPVEHKRVIRIFCREKPPVGGISVKEHFEINVVPLTIGLTKKFYDTMLKFCFPERDPETIETEDMDEKGKKNKMKSKSRDSNFYVHIDDVEKMKERAEKNKLFIYIKIPEVPVRLSYKGNKEKNLEDIRDFSLVIPTLEYHNVTWTWLDLLLAIRSDSRKVLLSQAIKQKLQFKRNIIGSNDESSTPHEEEVVRMLFGGHHGKDKKKKLK